ncbi:hypothetical protein BJ085DRAFT_27390 [Dimargaris cristalligena]|uniref:Splicing factor U2AF 23 kDa subunit n=1 Tax=Dimargaris cristalligena TaxID=215637 RepID=A0A4P9ZS17_9FUNG|nr:hypothetical protein BJ085DRAFT_27390 [Dimargaris cristalligena]|eukprot:RKP36207.1 hypothetical protein BJ085DRAFT_27390 [Dimargaris cristalligena]
MAHYLASIYGTEKDKVNCSFYFKIGACRHGDRCSRKHIKPTFSQTILLPNFYRNPARDPDCRASSAELQDHFDDFYEDVFTDMALNYGEVDRIRICDNDGEHLSGNVYVQFRYEDDAQRAVEGLNNRYYQGRPVYAELSPVTDFHEARCRQHEFDECDRRGLCNFMHLKYPSSSLKRELQRSQELYRHERRKEERRARRGREREGEDCGGSCRSSDGHN